MDRFEVIIIDDGSSDGTQEVAEASFPFRVRYFRQVNQGDASARNAGARKSAADFLVFIDDDILVETDYLSSLIEAHGYATDCIVVGKEHLLLKETAPAAMANAQASEAGRQNVIKEISFAEVCSNNMSLRREAYFDIGIMDSLDFPGSSMWCDVDFAFRALQKGYAFWQIDSAVCWHKDYVAKNLHNRKRRMREASYRAVALFQKHPNLLQHLPMFRDKTPIQWLQEPPWLIVRKMARHLASTDTLLRCMEWLADFLVQHRLCSHCVPALHQWIVGGHIYRGFRQGLRELQPCRVPRGASKQA
jgi:GT2 family glycosyltransferase